MIDEPTRFVQVGTWSLLILAVVMVPVIGLTLSQTGGLAAAIFAFVAAIVLVFVMATLTIEVDDSGVAWYFTARISYRRIAFDEIASCEATRILPLSFGYRIGLRKRAWIATGRNAVTIHDRISNNDLIVGCDDPTAVIAEIERRRAHR